MENAFLLVLSGFLRSVMWQIVMFLLCGIAFELLLEFIKATLFPKDEKGESRSCPRWLGLVMGAGLGHPVLLLPVQGAQACQMALLEDVSDPEGSFLQEA